MTGQDHQKEVYLYFCVTPQLTIFTLELMNFGVWHKRDSSKAGEGRRKRTFWRLLKREIERERVQHLGVIPHFVYQTAVIVLQDVRINHSPGVFFKDSIFWISEEIGLKNTPLS